MTPTWSGIVAAAVVAEATIPVHGWRVGAVAGLVAGLLVGRAIRRFERRAEEHDEGGNRPDLKNGASPAREGRASPPTNQRNHE